MKKIIFLLFLLLIPFTFGLNVELNIDKIGANSNNIQMSEGVIATDGTNYVYFNIPYSSLYNAHPIFLDFTTQSDGILQDCEEYGSCLLLFYIEDDFCSNSKTTSLIIQDRDFNQVLYTPLEYYDETDTYCIFKSSFTPPLEGNAYLLLNYTDEGSNNLEYNETLNIRNYDGQSSGSNGYSIITTTTTTSTTITPSEKVEKDNFFEKEIFKFNMPFFNKSSFSEPISIQKKEIHYKMKHNIFLLIIILIIMGIKLLKENKK